MFFFVFFFREDKLKLDTFISARAAEEPVTAYQKSSSLITQLKVREIVTVPDKWEEEFQKEREVFIKHNPKHQSTRPR